MERPRHQFLARAGAALDQHRLGAQGEARQFQQGVDHHRIAKPQIRGEPFCQVVARTFAGQVGREAPRQLKRIRRLLEVVPDTLLERIDGVRHAAVIRDDVEGRIRSARKILGQKVESDPVLQPQIHQQGIRCGLGEDLPRLAKTPDSGHAGTQSGQGVLQTTQDAGVIVHEKQ